MGVKNSFKRLINDINVYQKKIKGSPIKIKTDMFFCALIYGATPSNYYKFEFSKISAKERKSFITHRLNEKLMKKYNSEDSAFVDILYDKVKFAQFFSEYYGRSFIDSQNLDFEDFKRFTADKEKIICKPLRGGEGRGIEVFEFVNGNCAEVFEKVKKLPRCIIDEWIVQEKSLSCLYPESINPIRIQTINSNGVIECLASTLTIGNKAKFANASANSIFALVDKESGTVISDGCDYLFNIYEKTPETDVMIKGFQLPFWKETLDLVKKAALKIPQIGYIGWDIALTENGPILIEGNNDAGYVGYQLPLLTGVHLGIKNKVKRFL